MNRRTQRGGAATKTTTEENEGNQAPENRLKNARSCEPRNTENTRTKAGTGHKNGWSFSRGSRLPANLSTEGLAKEEASRRQVVRG